MVVIERRVAERKVPIFRKQFLNARGDKSARAQAIRGRIAMRGLCVPTGATVVFGLSARAINFPRLEER